MLLIENQAVFEALPPNYWLDSTVFGLEGPEEPRHRAAELHFHSMFPGSVQTFTVRGAVPPMTFRNDTLPRAEETLCIQFRSALELSLGKLPNACCGVITEAVGLAKAKTCSPER